MVHIAKAFGVVNKAEVDASLEFSGFFCEPVIVGNVIAGSSAFSKSSLYIWKFSVDVLKSPSLKDFEHNLSRMGKGQFSFQSQRRAMPKCFLYIISYHLHTVAVLPLSFQFGYPPPFFLSY